MADRDKMRICFIQYSNISHDKHWVTDLNIKTDNFPDFLQFVA